ncbi:MAG: nuclear transport factor 2 family protein [Dehalococcoidia bacterium]
MADEHPARAASRGSMSAVSTNAREEWLALFADDAIIEDPIGVSILDPEGKGFRGKAEIAGFWDRNIGTNKIQFDIHHSYAAGDEVANTGTITTTLENGMKAIVEGTFVYRVNDEGKLISMRAYWEVDKLQLIGP